MRADRIKKDPKVIELTEKYPLLFKEGCLQVGFHLPAGWEALVGSLCHTIENQLEHFVPEEIRGEIYVVQIKEKFGTLRVYLNQSTPYIDGAIELAEALSYKICEMCGNSGTLRQGGYVRTLCDAHDASEKAKAKEEYKIYIAEQKVRAEKKEEQRLQELEKLESK